jgi:diaminopimelate epimerase
VEWLSPDPEADIRIRLINADGSPAEISGNGTRCVAAQLVSKLGKDRVVIRTDAGLRTCVLTAGSSRRFEFETAMGTPQLGNPFSIRLTYGEVSGTPVSMGNPHFVVFVEEFHPGWQTGAAEIGRHHSFPQGMNVELVKVVDRHATSVLFFERGAGETQSSGTGSCAAAVAAIGTGKAASPVEVRAAGGSQTVRWEDEVFLSSPAQLVCEGEFFL